MPPDDIALQLARCPGLSPQALQAAATESGGTLARIASLGADRLRALKWKDDAISALRQPADPALLERDRAVAAQSDIRLLGAHEPEFPLLLLESGDAPAFLWVRGDVGVLSSMQLAIVGSRHPTATGREDAFDFSRHLAGGGLTITSGLAVGIDTAAHRGALAARGRTIAVAGTGIDQVYPAENRDLARDIVEGGGALVSEFPPGTPPLKAHFPQRNRLISGLSLGVFVVEAARRSGSLSTANWARRQGREVFALPGSIHNPLAQGCHELIRTGAKLVEGAPDILTELRIPFSEQELRKAAEPASKAPEGGPRLDNEYEILLDALGFEAAGMDALVARTGLKAGAIASMLLILELEGRVQQHPGGRFCRRSPGKV